MSHQSGQELLQLWGLYMRLLTLTCPHSSQCYDTGALPPAAGGRWIIIYAMLLYHPLDAYQGIPRRASIPARRS